MLYPFSIALYVSFVVFSSIWLERALHPFWVIAAAVCFMFTVLNENRSKHMQSLQILFLVVFHFAAQINWCHPLYLILTAREYHRTQSIHRSVGVAVFYFALYSSIRLSYSPTKAYDLLVTIADLFSSLFVVFLIFLFLQVQKERRQLEEEARRLVSRDALTGLMNFTEFHKQLQALTHSSEPFILFLLDCHDLKTINFEQGYSGGNQLLIKLAESLEKAFPDARLIARCGGDDFALVVPATQNGKTVQYCKDLLDHRVGPELGVELIYGEAVFPEEGGTRDEIISAAERKLFLVKRELWLKREENMLRAEKLRVVGELAAGMAHEIRNPMTTVKGFLQISKENSYNIEPYYELLMMEVSRVSELTSELLQFSKPHAGDVRVIHLQESIQRAVSLAEAEANYYSHLICYEPESEELYVRMDRDKLVQVLLNLLKNAFDAMPEPGTVTITSSRSDEWCTIEVMDTGTGMSEQELQQIFNPFFTTKETGTGLGLSICHKIMNDHGGSIEVQSREQHGTVFRMTLPLATGAQKVL
ncbi:UNVERIFIED_CONTAM: diguanylate cyclase (GGDEF)-like protein [Brevibacillus sp. OAP136]